MSSKSPPAKSVKRVKLESISPKFQQESAEQLNEDVPDDLSENHCAICLQEVVDRTMIPPCSHDLFCFDCLMVWTEQSRRCPLCSQNIGDHVIHNYRSRYDYSKHFLSPLRTSSPKLLPLANRPVSHQRRRRIPREVRERSRREREEREEADRFERALAKRKWIYRHDLYAKHIASNSYTRFRPFPTPAQFAASPDLISRTTSFLRRELLVWMDLDVEFLTTFIISLMKAIDIRSETAVKLLAEFLDMDAPYVEGGRHVNAEHFAHEVYSYVRSPYKDLFVYDTVVQYETPSRVSPPHGQMKSRRRSPREERDRRSRSRSRSRSMSWSPSGRVNPSSTSRQRAMGEGVRRSPSFELSSHPTEHVTGTRMSEQSSTLSRLSVRGDFRSKGKRKADSDVPISFELASSRNSRFLERNDSPHSSSAKGKEKAHSLDHISSEPASEVEQVTQVPYAVTSSAVPNKKPARILNLRALVQSHVSTDEKVPVTRSAPSLSIEGQGGLSSSLPMSKFGVSVEDAVPQLRIKGQGKPSSSSQLSPPSLLSRLSDTHLGEENVPVSTVLPSNDHRHLDGDEQPRPFPPSSERMSSLTALSGRHDTTGRVRDHRTVSQEIGNIGPIKAGDSDIDHDSRVSSQKYQASASNRDSEEVHPPHVASRFTYEARMNGGKLGSDPRPSSSSVSTVNTRLLQRLEEEKRYLQENNPTPLSPTTLEDSVEIVVGMEDLSSSVSIDSQDMETKLRTRARLRMRLASEKRAFREKSS